MDNAEALRPVSRESAPLRLLEGSRPGYNPPVMRRLAFALLLLYTTTAAASELGLSGAEGHPRARFPLALYWAPRGDAAMDRPVQRAVDDWNRLAREVLGVAAFTSAEPANAVVTLTIDPATSAGPMGETDLSAGPNGVIAPPVRIVVFEPASRGQTPADVVLYQVVAHELGHALGLEHTREPRSIMCCVRGSIDFNDPIARQAYVDARRHPEVRSAALQLRSHYDRFWNR